MAPVCPIASDLDKATAQYELGPPSARKRDRSEDCSVFDESEKKDLIMHRVTEERTHRECGWKHGEGHGVVALDRKEPPRRLDKQCLLIEVRLSHMTADRPELVRHTSAVDDQRGCAEG